MAETQTSDRVRQAARAALDPAAKRRQRRTVLIWFAALWFHLTHGFWSALQTIGWNNQIWYKRLKVITCAYVTIVILGFTLVVVFAFCKANGLFGLTPYMAGMLG